MKRYMLDGRTVSSRESLHRSLAALLHFPEWYGGNLDALYDCLTDLEEDTCLYISDFSALEQVLGAYALDFVQVLADAAGEDPHFAYVLDEQERV